MCRCRRSSTTCSATSFRLTVSVSLTWSLLGELAAGRLDRPEPPVGAPLRRRLIGRVPTGQRRWPALTAMGLPWADLITPEGLVRPGVVGYVPADPARITA